MIRKSSLALILVIVTVLTGCGNSVNLSTYDDGIVNMQLDLDEFIINDTLVKEGALQISKNGVDIVICINYTTALSGTVEQTLLSIKDSLSVGHTVTDYTLRRGSNGVKVCTEAVYKMIDTNGQTIYAKEKVLTRDSYDAITVWYLAYEYVSEEDIALFDNMYSSIDWSPKIDQTTDFLRQKHAEALGDKIESE